MPVMKRVTTVNELGSAREGSWNTVESIMDIAQYIAATPVMI